MEPFIQLIGLAAVLAWLVFFTALATVAVGLIAAYYLGRQLTVDHWRGIGLGILAYAMDLEQREEFLRNYEEWTKKVYNQYHQRPDTE